MTGMLAPLRIVEFAEGVAGPLAACRLGDLGADVVKLERAEGDWLRQCPPFLADSSISAAFFALNRGKRSLAIGKSPDVARAMIERLLEQADVVITDKSEAELAALGIEGLDAEKPRYPRLIVASLSDLGEHGPLAGKPGSELTAQAMAGYTRYLGRKGEPAVRLGADVAGASTGIFATQAILAALFARRRTGKGQRVSLSLLNSLLAMKTVHLAAQSDPDAYSGPRVGGAHDPPERGWKTADAPITFMFGGSVGAEGRAGWEDFVAQMGLAWMREDTRFDKTGRETTGLGPKARELKPSYESEFVKHPSAEIVGLVRKLGGLATAYQTHAQVLAHPQTKALGAIEEVPSGDGGSVACLAFPARFGDGPGALKGNCPELGEHTCEVAIELGFSAAEIKFMLEA